MDKIKVCYMKHLYNWGDCISPFIISNLTGKKTKHINGSDMSDSIRYATAGSIVSWCKNPNTIIWGSGLISNQREVKTKFKEICAVRGKLTRECLIKKGYKVPEIYGDPALLVPRWYNNDVKKRYRIGIIPHYIDVDNKWIDRYRNNDEIKIIDITHKSLDEVYSCRFIDDVLSCDKIISSSLHGIICANAYGIDALWVEFSDKVIGDGFKFLDYYSSIGSNISNPIRIDDETNIECLIKNIPNYDLNINLNNLYDSHPFKR